MVDGALQLAIDTRLDKDGFNLREVGAAFGGVPWQGMVGNMVKRLTLAGGVPFTRVNLDPIVLDLDGTGLHLSGLDGSRAMVDTGGLQRRTGWVDGTSGNAVLVLGSETGAPEVVGLRSGDALASLGSMDTNADGVLDMADAGFMRLGAWRDMNGNGTMDAGEAVPLWAVGVRSLSLAFVAGEDVVSGNVVHGTLSFTHVHDILTGQHGHA